jgi:hypothetical protein
MSLQIGEILAEKYRIVRLLGKGGMGEVYEGENTRIRRRVAIKTLLSAVSSKPDVVQRFEREAQAAGRIGSEHIVEVLDLGDLPDGSRFMVMEFLEGTTLSDRIVSRGRISARDSARLVSELLDGLGAAHQAGIIHRDLKPANVFLLSSKQGRADFVKILDFGVSKFSVLSDDMSMTSTGAVVGTPYYMSPEQAKGAKFIDARSDLYSVGVILYESITGQVPFNAQTFNELIFKIALETPPPPESFVPDLDPRIATIMRRAMARDSVERYQTAREFKDALDHWIADFDREASAQAPRTNGAPQGWPQQARPQQAMYPGQMQQIQMQSMQMQQPQAQQAFVPRMGGTHLMTPQAHAAAPASPYAAPNAPTAAAALPRPPATVAIAAPTAPIAPSKKSSMLPVAVVGGVLALGAIGIGAALFIRGKSANASDAKAASTPVTTAPATEQPKATSRPTATAAADTTPTATVTATSTAVVLDASAASAAPTATAVAQRLPDPPNVPVGPAHPPPPPPPSTPTPPPTGKPGGRTISGSLD